jgi:hypothetical protein
VKRLNIILSRISLAIALTLLIAWPFSYFRHLALFYVPPSSPPIPGSPTPETTYATILAASSIMLRASQAQM